MKNSKDFRLELIKPRKLKPWKRPELIELKVADVVSATMTSKNLRKLLDAA